jgi:hypothetical protein
MARLMRKTAKVSGSGGGKINVRGREWTKEDLRELKNHSREKTPAKIDETNGRSFEAKGLHTRSAARPFQP